MDTLVSIAIPVYNTARFLPAALDSLLAQDHPHWECLLWDDGSTDGSSGIAADYARRDPRFRLLGNGRNNGVGIALASALDAARGAYVGVLDSDDALEPDALSAMLAFMAARPQVGMAYSQYVEIDEDGNELGPGGRFRIPYSAHHLLLEFMTHHFRLIRADAYRDVGGSDPGADAAPDYDLCLRLSERHAVEHLPRPLYRYRIRRDSISHGSRLRQVRASFEAAQRALQRRGMDRDHALSLGLRARHVLRPKPVQGLDPAVGLGASDPDAEQCLRQAPPFDPASASNGGDWAEQIEVRYRAFVADARRRGLDARYDCALEIDSWHILQPLRPFGGAGNWR
ncbi:MAG TPA: glycosyltransferase [Thermomonas sp.]|nr:glycosyltransferase [Thermomonas sp.]